MLVPPLQTSQPTPPEELHTVGYGFTNDGQVGQLGTRINESVLVTHKDNYRAYLQMLVSPLQTSQPTPPERLHTVGSVLTNDGRDYGFFLVYSNENTAITVTVFAAL
ncbi:hypothetical protein P7K49_039255 [Saguinus oedipus]|uniref:Uncharacterized protein n=1 Tax=Saguinus oedipus TaxID=9490 RepID=A0ABQ9TH02_SAGOE|nr:hypothetical protein P7K49_039255 [Saguinus oedipus]